MARKKVGKLYVIHGDHELYKKYSNEFYKILCKYSPDIERYSIDECFLDMTGTDKIFGDPVKLAYKIKDEIKEKLGFTVNVGVGNCKFCAKMASDFEKPDKVHTLFKDEIEEKLWPLDVKDMFMVGKSSSKKLKELGINTINDLAHADIDLLTKYFKSFAKTMKEYANGIDDSRVEERKPKQRGIGNSVTLPSDLTSLREIREVLKELSSMVGKRLRREEKYASVIAVQLKNSEFISYIHQSKLVNPISSNEDIYEEACKILKAMWKKDPIRLVGLRVTDFTDKSYEQISLFDKPGKISERNKVQKTVDMINDKYGKNTIISASQIKRNPK